LNADLPRDPPRDKLGLGLPLAGTTLALNGTKFSLHGLLSPTDIVTARSARLPRVFLRNGRPIAVSDLRGLVEESFRVDVT
jgi:hypothetical protein